MVAQPSGTVTYLFSDIEGSTNLLSELGGERYAAVLEDHRHVLREAFTGHGGYEVDCEGDSFFVAFASAREALAAAEEAQRVLADLPVHVRMGLHTGEALLKPPTYVGLDVHRAARIMTAAHGGQVLVSEATRAVLDDEVGLRDLGEHRLKDLPEPVRLYQVGEGDFPPLKSLNQTNLPLQPSPLVGRRRELSELLELVRASRLLTLTGPGGSGKTRLALEAAAELAGEFPDGVWFVSLAPLTDPQLVEPTIASTVGARGELSEFLSSRRLLLLLDNVEQLLPEAALPINNLLAAPDVNVVATSRGRLGVAAEQEFPVPTLVPDEAVELFTARARQLDPAFQPDGSVVQIAVRLDGLPLALELAAARVKVLTPAQILERLDHSLELLTGGPHDVSPRQRTLRATIEWSYALLRGEERALFAALAVFAGSFDVTAAEVVCGADLAALEALLDKGLIRRTEDGRFFMLAMLREFALGELVDTADAERARRAHLEHFTAIAREAHGHLADPDQAVWLDGLEREQSNFREALSWGLAHAPEQAQEMITWLGRFWSNRDHELEGYRWAKEALEHTSGSASSLRARGLFVAGRLATTVGKAAEGHELLDAAVRMFDEIGEADTDRALRAGFSLGAALLKSGDAAQAKVLFERASVVFSEPAGRGRATLMLGISEWALGEQDLARRHYKEAIAIAARDGDRHLEAAATQSLGDVHLNQGRPADAESHYRRSIELLRGLESRRLVGAALSGLAAVAAVDEDCERAGLLWGAVDALRTETGYEIVPEDHGHYDEKLAPCRSEQFDRAFELGQRMTLAEAVEAAIGGRHTVSDR